MSSLSFLQVLDFRFNPAATAPFELHSVYSHKGHLLVTSLHVTADQSHLLIGATVVGRCGVSDACTTRLSAMLRAQEIARGG